nr:zinc finger, CCHC-type [Tanacetum cinerariifolium]
MEESISVSSIIDKLPPSWKDFKHTLKHDDLSLVQLGSHLRIEESLRAQDSDKRKGKEVVGTSVNIIEEGGKNKHHKQNKNKKRSNENNSGSSSNKKPKLECWKCGKTGHFKRDYRSGKKNNANAGDRCRFKTYEPVKDGSVLYMGDDHFAPVHGKGSVALEFSSGKTINLFNVLAVVRLPDPKRKTLGEKGIDCIFVGYAEHSKAYSIEEDPRTYNEAIQSRDATFWKDAINDEIGSIMKNNTWVLSDLPTGCKPLVCKWIIKRKMKVDGSIDKFKARLVIQGFRQKEGIDYFDTYASVARITTIRLLLALAAIHNLVIHQMDVKTGDLDEEVYMKQPKGFVMPDCSSVSTPMDPVEKLKPNTGKPIDQLEYSRAIGYLMYAMTSTRPDISYAVGRLSYSDASWINHVKNSSSTNGWVFLLGGGSISWASKKQTCITSSTIESKFVTLAAAGKKAEWLRNLIHKISIWPKPIAPISIRCDSAPTKARAYGQIYNGKSRHLEAEFNMESSYLEIGTQVYLPEVQDLKGPPM